MALQISYFIWFVVLLTRFEKGAIASEHENAIDLYHLVIFKLSPSLSGGHPIQLDFLTQRLSQMKCSMLKAVATPEAMAALGLKNVRAMAPAKP